MGPQGRLAAALVLIGATSGCRGDAADVGPVPDALRDDYAVFAQRCSKCHSLARPLGASVDDDVFWRRYVEQMRLKPGSAISMEDEVAILRFLHWWSQTRRGHGGAPEAGVAEAAVGPAAAVASDADAGGGKP